MRRLVFTFFICLSISAFAQNKRTADIYFDSDIHKLSASNKASLDSFMTTLPKPIEQFGWKVMGHTDTDGSKSYNKKLSLDRSSSTKSYILGHGVKDENVLKEGHDYSRPRKSNKTASGKAANRRVEIEAVAWSEFLLEKGGIKKEPTIIEFDASEGYVLKNPSGSEFRIPPNAFLDENGNPVKGKVKIEYNEYRDAADFIQGGLPMNWNENGKPVQFNSSGMFKIKAYQDGKELKTNPENKIKVKFPLKDPQPNTRFYNLNRSNQWDETNAAPAAGENVCLNNEDPCKVQFETVRLGKKLSESKDVELLAKTFEERFKDLNYVGTDTKTDKIYTAKFHIRIRPAMDEKSEKQLGYKIVANSAYNPELKSLRDAIFYCPDCKSKMEKKWVDARLHIMNATSVFTLELKDTASFEEIRITLINQKNKNKISTSAGELYKNYKEVLDNRRKKFDDRLKKDFAKSVFAVKDDYYCFYENSKEFMASGEKNMSFDKWLNYFDKNIPLMNARYDSIHKTMVKNTPCFRGFQNEAEPDPSLTALLERQKRLNNGLFNPGLVQEFELDEMGEYNFDQLLQMDRPISIKARYTDAKGNKIDAKNITVVDKAINGALSFYPYEFPISPFTENVILVFAKSGHRYVVDSSQLTKDKLKENEFHYFSVKDVTKQTSTGDGIREVLGLPLRDNTTGDASR